MALIRKGPPLDDQDDYQRRVWAGVLPVRMEAGEAVLPGWTLRLESRST